jgi:cell filamentation protein
LSFLTLLAEQAGHALALDHMNPDAMLRAMIKSFAGEEEPLAALVSRLIS